MNVFGSLVQRFSDERRQLKKVLATVPRTGAVLDVGCGVGRNIALLKRLGFMQVVGVEKNERLVLENRKQGINCVTPDELEAAGESHTYDLLLMSHIIEHFDYVSLLQFMNTYLRKLRPGGYLIVVTPLWHDCFYNDFDHVKPYLPMGIQMVFGKELSQVQVQSDRVLALEDIRFYRDQFRVRFHRSLFVRSRNRFPIWVNRALKLVFLLSGGVFGRKMGWMGLYRYIGQRTGGPSRTPG